MPLPFVLHPAQQNVLFAHSLHADNHRYHFCCYTEFEDLDVAKLQQSWSLLVNQLDILRLKFSYDEQKELTQFIARRVKQANLSSVSLLQQPNPEQAAQEWVVNKNKQTFTHWGKSLCQASLLQLSENKYYFFTKCHYLILDPQGGMLLHSYVQELYRCLTQQLSTMWLSKLPQYQMNINQANQYMTSRRYQQDKAFWQQFYHQNALSCFSLQQNQKGVGFFNVDVDIRLFSRLQQFCKLSRVTMQELLLASVARVTAMLLHESEVVVNFVHHGRTRGDVKQTVGMYANLSAVLCNIDPEATLIDFVQSCRDDLSRGLIRHRFPAAHLAKIALDAKGSINDVTINYSEIDQAEFAYRYFQLSEVDCLSTLTVNLSYNNSLRAPQFSLVYRKEYFDEQQIERYSNYLLAFFANFLKYPYFRLKDIQLVPKQEKTQLIMNADTLRQVPSEQSLISLFELRVKKHPRKVALVSEEGSMTYEELDIKSTQLAQHIKASYYTKYGVELCKGSLIAIYIEPSFDQIISLLAVMKVGAAYVPISIFKPAQHAQFILKDTMAPFIITSKLQSNRLINILEHLIDPPNILLTDDATGVLFAGNMPSIQTHSTDLACLVYSSNRTRQLVGVMVEQRGIISLVQSTQNIKISTHDTLALFGNQNFDGGLYEIWSVLTHGAKLAIAAPCLNQNTERYKYFLSKYQISILLIRRHLLSRLYSKDQSLFATLRYLVVDGKARADNLLKILAESNEGPKNLINAYFVTEGTVLATSYNCQQGVKKIPLGRASHLRQAYVLDEHQALLPIGAIGELYIGGAGVVKGYFNCPKLTARYFIDNPFMNKHDVHCQYNKLYRTGDLVRWMSNGHLEYIGSVSPASPRMVTEKSLSFVDEQLPALESEYSLIID